MSERVEADDRSFLEGSVLLESAYRLAVALHHGPRRRGNTTIDHPLLVATLLAREGFDEPVVAAALLHDVIEDTEASVEEIEREFGPEIAALVAEMTESERIEAYRARKAEHRARAASDPRVAAIYAADKLANTRSIRQRGERGDAEKLEHYLQTLVLLEREQPDLPFLGPLREELTELGRSFAPQTGDRDPR